MTWTVHMCDRGLVSYGLEGLYVTRVCLIDKERCPGWCSCVIGYISKSIDTDNMYIRLGSAEAKGPIVGRAQGV